jgi:hypothetical protein
MEPRCVSVSGRRPDMRYDLLARSKALASSPKNRSSIHHVICLHSYKSVGASRSCADSSPDRVTRSDRHDKPAQKRTRPSLTCHDCDSILQEMFRRRLDLKRRDHSRPQSVYLTRQCDDPAQPMSRTHKGSQKSKMLPEVRRLSRTEWKSFTGQAHQHDKLRDHGAQRQDHEVVPERHER